jgi:uncharacterized protein YdhG (YjbR/CyaY superfamily)
MARMDTSIKDVDTYLLDLPENVRLVLEELRQTIRQTAPNAEELISYGMPGYKYHGMLVYFAAFKNHCSFFPGSATMGKMEIDLKPYKTSKGTIQFTIDKPLPTELVERIVKERMIENEAKMQSKKSSKTIK